MFVDRDWLRAICTGNTIIYGGTSVIHEIRPGATVEFAGKIEQIRGWYESDSGEDEDAILVRSDEIGWIANENDVRSVRFVTPGERFTWCNLRQCSPISSGCLMSDI